MSRSTSDHTHPEIPDRSWSNPFPDGHPLQKLYERRVKNEQDLTILIDDYYVRKGTGKTVASLQLAQGMNQHGELTKDHATLTPEELRNAYGALPERSGLVLDEGEVGISNRRAMTNTNEALREIFSMGRVEEKYVIINAPSFQFIDKDIRQLADVWISMVVKGVGIIHWIKPEAYSSKVLTPKEGLIQFKDVKRGTQLREVYNHLTREKRKKIDGDEGQSYIPLSEHEQALEDARQEARRDERNEIMKSLYSYGELDVSQRQIGEVVGLTQQQVGNILRGD